MCRPGDRSSPGRGVNSLCSLYNAFTLIVTNDLQRAEAPAAATVTHAMKRFTPFYDCLTLPIEWLRTKRDDSLPTSNLACSSVTNRGRRPSDLERFKAREAARGQAEAEITPRRSLRKLEIFENPGRSISSAASVAAHR